MQIKPYSSRYKIYIIDEAEKLTVQAQNALLKTIEERRRMVLLLCLRQMRIYFTDNFVKMCKT